MTPQFDSFDEVAHFAFRFSLLIVFLIWLLSHVVRDIYRFVRFVRRLWRALHRENSVTTQPKLPTTLPQAPT